MKVQLPEELKSYQNEAESEIQRGAVKEIEFSGSTYQVLVENSELQKFWVFLQLNGKNEIKDAFCSGEHEIESPHCLHVAIAYLSLFGISGEPLHLRFLRSLWNKLCFLFEDRLGSDPRAVRKKARGKYLCESNSGKRILEIQGLTEDAIQDLEKILHKKEEETEETSLKFSNLTMEELVSWREGNPPRPLRYMLSFWSDIAKWLMRKQDNGDPYQISFKYSKKELPNWIQVDFDDLMVGFYISEVNLPQVIESLNTVKSPLNVYHSAGDEIERVIYDKEEQVLRIEGKNKKSSQIPKKSLETHSGISINGWSFVPGKGFYANEPIELLRTPVLYGQEISEILSEHSHLISSLIVDCRVQRESISLSYHLEFDQDWNLHITAFLFELGDLTTGFSWVMGDWAYLDNDGFYSIEGNRFHDAEIIVSIHQVSDFVSQNRSFLNLHEGFHTHIRSMEYQLSYHISPQKRLTFIRNVAMSTEGIRQQDFGAWVYLEGHGFYSKSSTSFHFLLRSGMSLSAEQIPLFIRMNQEELALIPHFFCNSCPVVKSGLRIELEAKQKVKITPEFELKSGYHDKVIQLFDEFVYLEGEGFHELPLDMRLPEKFRLPIEIEKEELLIFLTYEIDSLYSHASYVDPQLFKPQTYHLGTDFIEPVQEKGRGWYRFHLYYLTEKGRISVNTLKASLKKKFHFLFSDAGLIDLRNEQFDWLRQHPKERFEKDSILLTSLEFMRLNAYDPIVMLEDENGLISAESQAHMNQLTQLHTHDKPVISDLKCELRPYQEIGVEWLWFLYCNQLSGLLCDDMGLGKTHQTMALLGSINNFFKIHAEGNRPHFLIVCPTSVIYHWQEKLQQYLPSLNVCTFYGINRNLETFHQEYDILLTSYGILRNEREVIGKIVFEAAVFDEIQIAKNQFSKVYEALLNVKTQMRLGLTGTPIENHLRELKSLFDIVLPSYLPGEQAYRNFFIKPIEKENDIRKKTILRRLIHPFVLRRKKENVLKDLPEKMEEVSYCDLNIEQEQLYTEVLEQKRMHLMEELRNDHSSVPYLHIFALLSSLKQICNHPALFLKRVEEYQKYQSGKWDLFLELLREARESEQKIVIFSQYLGMLDIIESYLTEQNVGFAALRGATHNRKEQIQRFNQDPQCEVFVGSLHAAGLGIDLTAGSVVIHYDRWWNAARENQATDRVHRIGQTRGVQVFKLVTKGTFEEKIDEMIKRKGKLMEEVVGIDDHQTLKKFSREELMELLDFVKKDHDRPLDSDDIK